MSTELKYQPYYIQYYYTLLLLNPCAIKVPVTLCSNLYGDTFYYGDICPTASKAIHR